MATTANTKSSVQAKIVDKPIMFRGRGLHPRCTEPGEVAPRFSRNNTNVPLWTGDAATLQAPPARGEPHTMQRFQGKIDVEGRHVHAKLDHFFVAKKGENAPAPQAGRVSKADDDLHLSRKVMNMEQKERTGLHVGEFVPTQEASPPSRFGKKTQDNHASNIGRTGELVHHGKKPFPTTAGAGATANANQIGGAGKRQAEMVGSTADLQQSKRFEASKRHSSSLNSGLQATESAPCQEFDFDSRRKHAEVVPGNKSGKTLQYVFEQPKKNIDASYRPTAPW